MIDSHPIRVGKLDAARRQFSTAIDLLFSKADPISVHTLIGASSNIISDLVGNSSAERSWDKLAQEANDMPSRQYFLILRTAQNFLKHAKNDPCKSLNFDPADSDHLGFLITLNLGELDCKLSGKESLFQLWYLACYSQHIVGLAGLERMAFNLFGNLAERSRHQRIMIGSRILGSRERIKSITRSKDLD